MSKSFNLEEQYQFYLDKVGLKESQLGETQKIETRRAFMAGITQACQFYISLATLEEDAALKELDNVLDQVSKIWRSL